MLSKKNFHVLMLAEGEPPRPFSKRRFMRECLAAPADALISCLAELSWRQT